MYYLMQVTAVLLLSVSLASVVHAASHPYTFNFLLMVASGSSPDSSAVVSTVDQTLEEINNIPFPFQLKYIKNDTKVS